MGLVNVLLPKKFSVVEVDFVTYDLTSVEIFRGDSDTPFTMVERISPKASHIHGEYAYSSIFTGEWPCPEAQGCQIYADTFEVSKIFNSTNL